MPDNGDPTEHSINTTSRKSRLLRRAAYVFAAFIGLVFVALAVFYFIGGNRINRNYDLQPASVAIPGDQAAIERGRQLVTAITGCNSCHGDDLGGDTFIDEDGLITVNAPNLTSGVGGVGADYSDDDWVRAIRHGINPEGKGLIVMPAQVFQNLTESDLGAVVAYMKTVPPVDREFDPPSASSIGRVFIGAGLFGEPVPAQELDHDSPFPPEQEPAVTAEYGSYLVSIGHCAECHGDSLEGSKLNPGALDAPNITATGSLGSWDASDFASTIRTGITPDGRVLNVDEMPWDIFLNMTDEELEAIFLYLRAQ